MIVIGLSGKKGSGKDTAAQYLGGRCLSQGAHKLEPRSLALADSLKKFVSQWFGIPLDWMYTEEGKQKLTHLLWDNVPFPFRGYTKTLLPLPSAQEQGELDKMFGAMAPMRVESHDPRVGPMTVREVLQIWGTDFLRAADPECHVRRWKQEAELAQKQGCPLLFVPDVRFPNEVATVLGFSNRSHVVRLTRNPYDDKHSSELALDGFPWGEHKRARVVDNSTNTVEEFKDQLNKVFDDVVGRPIA
jgi:hypothetical protein